MYKDQAYHKITIIYMVTKSSVIFLIVKKLDSTTVSYVSLNQSNTRIYAIECRTPLVGIYITIALISNLQDSISNIHLRRLVFLVCWQLSIRLTARLFQWVTYSAFHQQLSTVASTAQNFLLKPPFIAFL